MKYLLVMFMGPERLCLLIRTLACYKAKIECLCLKIIMNFYSVKNHLCVPNWQSLFVLDILFLVVTLNIFEWSLK